MTRHFTIPLSLLCCACTPESPPMQDDPVDVLDAEIELGYPQLGACEQPEPEPTHLLVTSTDFTTGAVGLIDLSTHEVRADLALASSDALPLVIGERAFVINRYGFDYIDELDLHADLELVHEWPIASVIGDEISNPQWLILDPLGHAWVSLYGAPELQRFTFPSLQNAAVELEFALDLSRFADADGLPELGRLISCGPVSFFAVENIDRDSWLPIATTRLLPFAPDVPPLMFEFDVQALGADGITLLGSGAGPWRLDPGDPTGHTILLLDSGLERVDLQAGTSEWLVPDTVFMDAGYERLQLSGFDLDAAGRVWISAATPDYAAFHLLRVELSGVTPSLVVERDDLQSTTGALEIAGSRAYFADTTLGASGVRIFELAESPVGEAPESPLPVGLAPMSLAPLRL